jgi:hypothetical protein
VDLPEWSFPAVVVVRGKDPVPSFSGASPTFTIRVPRTASVEECVLAGARKVTTDNMILLQAGHRLLPEGMEDVVRRLQSLPDRPACALPGVRLLPGGPFRGGEIFELASSPEGLPRSQFVTADIDRPFTISLSGLVAPVGPVLRFCRVLRAFARSIRFGSMMLALPGMRRVIQSPLAAVEMPGADLLQTFPQAVVRAAHARYAFAQALYADDAVLCDRLTYEMVSTVIYARSLVLLAAVKAMAVRSAVWPSGKQYGAVAGRAVRDAVGILRFPDAGRRRG